MEKNHNNKTATSKRRWGVGWESPERVLGDSRILKFNISLNSHIKLVRLKIKVYNEKKKRRKRIIF